MAVKSVRGKAPLPSEQLQSGACVAARPERDRPLLSINGDYTIAPTTTSVDMANDVGCLLESARAAIDIVIDGLSEEGSQMTANASVQVPRLLFGVSYQLEMVGNLVSAMRISGDSSAPEHLS